MAEDAETRIAFLRANSGRAPDATQAAARAHKSEDALRRLVEAQADSASDFVITQALAAWADQNG